MRLLLVEDDPTTSRSVELMLSHCNINVYATDLGEEAIDLAKLYDYDIMLLNVDLPDMSGHEVVRALRLARVSTPIMMLTGDDSTDSKIKAFGFGADDYLTKPFHREELVARIQAIVRRSKGHSESIMKLEELEVRFDDNQVFVDGKEVHLTGKEYHMVELLAFRKGTILTKEMFMDHLYGGMDEPELKIIDVFICKLRKKLGTAGELVHTVWGRGYTLRERDKDAEGVPETPEPVGDAVRQ